MVSCVVLVFDDIDEHGWECDCGLCNFKGRSFGVGIYPVPEDFDFSEQAWDDLLSEGEVLERVYAPSEEAARYNARLRAEKMGFKVLTAPKE